MAHRPRRPRLRTVATAAVAAGIVLAGAAAPGVAAADPGAGWTVTPLPVDKAALSRIATGGGTTFTVGFGLVGSGRDMYFTPFAARRAGGVWVTDPTPVPDGGSDGRLDDVAVLGPEDAWAVGRSEGQDTQALIEHWNGTAWSLADTSALPAGTGLTGVTADRPDDVWAVGYTVLSDGVTPLVAHWDGTSWTQVQIPDSEGDTPWDRFWVSSVSASAPDDVWLVGVDGLAVHYDGRTWTRTPVAPGREVWLERVRSDPAHGTWAVGYGVATDGTRTPAALHWDGTAWQTARLPADPGAQLEDLAFDSGAALAVGYRMTGTGPVGYAVRVPAAGIPGHRVPLPAGVAQLNSAAPAADGNGDGVWIAGDGVSSDPASFPPFAARSMGQY
ncbi:hypothetical protein [Peterkaempfera griseoplana]|uniref:hypothetical protein n=1 Tax=Peterkaempfera griseoplana TaxID=66896 RepID=UPI0006E1BD34|nr:hypothetical protein [Peterkaempfera griseoplana]